MRKIIIPLALFAAASVTAPQLAVAQNAQQSQSTAPIQQRVKSNLERAGYKNVQIMPSSFLVRATDQDGNPVMMVINPDSVTAVTALSAGQQTAQAQTGTNTSASGQNERISLSFAQKNEIWQTLKSQPKENAPAGFTPRVGETVPNSLQLQPLPGSLTGQVPAIKSYEYAMLQNQVLIVDPSSKKIVDIVSE
jgi:hypothetical protein